MHVLVIGGTGYIGSHVVERLVARGFEVAVFARGRTEPSLPRGVELVRGDRYAREDLAAAARRGFEAVVDIAAYKREETERAVDAFDGRISRFVHVSSVSVNQRTSGFPLRESDPLVSDPTAGYAYDKAECERALHQAHAKSDFPFVSLRPVVVFGPRDRISRENYYVKRLLSGDAIVLPDGGHTITFGLFVGDLAEAVCRALVADGAAGRAFHLMQRDRLSVAEHVRAIARLVGREAETVAVPSGLLARAGFNLSWFPYFLGGTNLDLDTSAAERVLDFRPTPYAEALEETVGWFLERDPESLPSIEDRYPPVMPRTRQSEFARRWRDRMASLEEQLLADSGDLMAGFA